MTFYTVFNLTNGHLQVPSGAYLSPRGDRDGKDRAYPVQIPPDSLLWRMADPRQGKPEVKIVEGDATGEANLPPADPKPRSEPGQEPLRPTPKVEAAPEPSPPALEDTPPEALSPDDTTPEEDLQTAVESAEAETPDEEAFRGEDPGMPEILEDPAEAPSNVTELPVPETSDEEDPADELADVMAGLEQDAEDDPQGEETPRSRGNRRRSRRNK